ncbi:unnamed protein product [Bathycoccus prasinos]
MDSRASSAPCATTVRASSFTRLTGDMPDSSRRRFSEDISRGARTTLMRSCVLSEAEYTRSYALRRTLSLLFAPRRASACSAPRASRRKACVGDDEDAGPEAGTEWKPGVFPSEAFLSSLE